MINLFKYINKTVSYISIKVILLTALLVVASCTTKKISDEEKIIELYAQMSHSFSQEDLRGIMKYISKEFESDVENQKNYKEVYKSRKTFILENSNVTVDFRNISIKLSKSSASVKLSVSFNTDQLTANWTEIDSLIKKYGSWKIISWKKMSEK
jgi:hypothetical protein